MSTAVPLAPSFTTKHRVDDASLVRPSRRLLTEGRVVFLLSSALYITLAAVLVFHYDSVLGDAMSRVGNASYMLYSRDPKLAAVGFVWTPLPSLLMLPFLPLKALWPALVTRGFLANIESAVLMAGAVVFLRSILADIGVSRGPRFVLVALFALNPMSLYYGANGMSEPVLLFFLLATLAPLSRWMRQPSPRLLVRAGTMLGLAYLGRYEALAAGAAAVGLVAIASFTRSFQDREHRAHAAVADAVLVGFPVLVTFLAWTGASWLIVGHPFDTFSSRYGNTAQVSSSQHGIRGAVGNTGLPALEYVGRQVLALAPALLPVLLIAAIVAWRRRDPWIVASLSVLGSVMAFQALTTAAGGSFGWLRFQITAIPLTALLVGYLLAPAWGRSERRIRLAPGRRRGRLQAIGAVVVAGCLTGVAIGTTAVAFADPVLAREEHSHLAPIAQRLWGSGRWERLTLGDLDGERSVAKYLDHLHLGRGTVLVDVALGFPIVLASSHLTQFVITTDRDFPDAVADPAASGVEFILVSRDTGTMDAISAVYPDMYDSGSGFARLAKEFPSPHGNGRTWRLYKVAGAPRARGLRAP